MTELELLRKWKEKLTEENRRQRKSLKNMLNTILELEEHIGTLMMELEEAQLSRK